MNRKKRLIPVALILIFGLCIFSPSLTWAQPKTHLVQKGDTLWDICEKYYGDPNLWPKLWQMNPFITNPHLLRPGDEVTLLEGVPVKRAEAEEEEKVPVKKAEEPKPARAPVVTGMEGIDVSVLTNVHALGYLSVKEVDPWGFVFASESGRQLLSQGETIFLHLNNGRVVKPGDQLNICRSSPLIKHPITGENLGYILSVLGRVVVEEKVGLGFGGGAFYKKEGVYKARIEEYYRELNVGDLVLPYEPISQCVQPISLDEPLVGNIVAAQDQRTLVASNRVVYLDHGFNDGVRRGNIFQAVRTHIVRDPVKGKTTDFITKPRSVILPDIPIGTIMVLESRPNTSTAVVISANEEFLIGTYVKGLSWVETPDLFTRIPNCPTE
ncbi:MAG: LysM peptidoglycan-binding domain-containing protein [Deltaproteobacteria bacterium]|nr:MAG: LysM peptidoglycan-binding domain-containing protein [Deltaproteobacteria bacterium]